MCRLCGGWREGSTTMTAISPFLLWCGWKFLFFNSAPWNPFSPKSSYSKPQVRLVSLAFSFPHSQRPHAAVSTHLWSSNAFGGRAYGKLMWMALKDDRLEAALHLVDPSNKGLSSSSRFVSRLLMYKEHALPLTSLFHTLLTGILWTSLLGQDALSRSRRKP